MTLILSKGLVMNIAGGVLYSYVKYRDGILDRRKKDYLKNKESRNQYSTLCDMNQNNKSSLIESGASDDYCDKSRSIPTTITTLVNEKV